VKLFRFNPTIRQANKYLTETVEVLSAKHGGVSKEEFEKELVATTGIGWKQVKNYKNHPKPSERLKDNAVVLKYVRQMRNKDTGRKVRNALFYSISSIAVMLTIYWYLSRPREIEQFVVHEVPPSAHNTEVKETRVFLKLSSRNWLFRLGPLNQSSVPLDKFVCADNPGTGTKNCSFNETTAAGSFQAFLLLDGGIVRRYSVLSFDPAEVKTLMGQLSEHLGDKIKRFPATDKLVDDINVDLGNESVRLTGSHPNQRTRLYLSVVVSGFSQN
jgi:hypothetical protein